MQFGQRTFERTRRRPTLIKDSSNGSSTRKHRADYWLLMLSFTLLVAGLIVVYSISPSLAVIKGVSENYYISKQLIAVGLGIVTLFITATIPTAWWRKAVIPLAVAAIIGSLVVQLTPLDEVYRAHRWIKFGGFSFQIAELIKFALLIGVADFLTAQWKADKLSDFKLTIRPLIILLAAIGIIVAKLQSDLGSTGVMLVMIVMMMFIVGLPLKRLLLIGGIISIGLLVAVSTTSYRRDRLFTFLHPESDCQSVGYQACQALIAVGTGGLSGLGLGKSVQAYGYLPEASNDSIFAIIAEKFGFIGVSVLLVIYGIFITRLKRIAERTNDQFNKLIVIGVLAWVSTQAVINIGAMIGLLPLKGITLPFVSYGGTSLIFISAALGLVFQISRYTSYSINEPNNSDQQTSQNSYDRRRVGRTYNPNLISRPRN